MPQWVEGSTRRLAQMSGKDDPDGLPHFNDTTAWGVAGVDLGATAVIGDRTYVFFGDVPPENGDLVAYLDDVPFRAGGHLAAVRRGPRRLDACFVGQDGAVYVVTSADGTSWSGPVRISRPALAPPGARLAAALQTAAQLDLFVLGRDGALSIAWAGADDIWQGPHRICGRGHAPPGGGLAAARPRDGRLDVFTVGFERRIHVHSVIDGGPWQAPVPISAQPFAPPGAPLAAVRRGADRLSVLCVGEDQWLYEHGVDDHGAWQGPRPIGEGPIAPAGSCLAAIEQPPDRASVLVVGHDRTLLRFEATGGGPWEGPEVIGAGPIAPPGGGVAAAVDAEGQATAFLIGDGGVLLAVRDAGRGTWRGPDRVGAPGVAPAGAPVAAISTADGRTAALFGNDAGALLLAPAEGDGASVPARLNPEMLHLSPVLKDDGTFHPLTLREGRRTWVIGGDATPTGAFGHDGKAYVFVVANEGVVLSSLVRSCCPAEPVPFDLVFRFSSLADPDGGKFLQVAPCVVPAADLPGFRADAGEGVILLGHGFTRRDGGAFGVHLAWLPLRPGRDPDVEEIRFYTGAGPDAWSPHESDAVPLFTTRFGWSSLSVGRIPGAGQWVVLYHTAGTRDDIVAHGTAEAPIVARVAATPWDLAAAPTIPILDPVRDGAVGRYLYRPDRPDPNDLRHRGVPLIGHPGFLYGPHLLNHYTTFDERSGVATFHFFVSTGWPYQVQLMRSSIRLP